MNRHIIHLELDAFLIAVEYKRNPGLKNKPFIIGGGNRQGVVAASSDETRKFGVQAGMPMYLALQLCPDIRVVTGNPEDYHLNSNLVTNIIAEEARVFEKPSINEFYIDASDIDCPLEAFKWAVELRKKIIKESALPVSMSMSVNKMVARIATSECKPHAEQYIPAGTEKDFIAPLAIEKLPTMSRQTATFLHDMGINTIANLRDMPLDFLISAFGNNGIMLWNYANGIDQSPVMPYQEQEAIPFLEDLFAAKSLKSTKATSLFEPVDRLKHKRGIEKRTRITALNARPNVKV